MKNVISKKWMKILLDDPKMRQAAEEIFEYVVQPNCEIKYNEKLLSLEDKININTLFLLNHGDNINSLKEGKERQINDNKPKRKH